MLYICDIDGTLADNSHRNPFDETKVHLDKMLPTCNVIRSLIRDGARVVFFSGRTKACQRDTRHWIQDALGLQDKPIELHMREIGDNRPDDIVKKEMLGKVFPDKTVITGVFDDRLKVCRMWYDLGLFVFNCNQGLKEF